MEPLEILNQWVEAVNQGDINKLISLYDNSAVLIPTFSNRILDTPEKIRDYFQKLGSREDLSITLHESALSIQSLTDKLYTINGIYNWRFKIDGEVLNFEARFSYIVNLEMASPIIHHHSSQVPRML